MPNVTINPINTINVRIDQNRPKTVSGATTFVGSQVTVQPQLDEIRILAQSAYDTANTKLNISGGTITGNLQVLGDITADHEVLDAGFF